MEQSGVSTRFLEHVSWRSLERVIETVGWSDQQAADALGLTLAEYIECKRTRAPMPASGTLILSDELQIDVEKLIYGTVDLIALAHHYRGEKIYLPERYLRSGHTKKRVAHNFLNYVERRFGQRKRTDLLRGLQINEAALANPEENISLNFSIDAIHWLYSCDRNESLIEEMGQNLLFANKNETLTKELAKSRSVFELLDNIFSGVLEKYLEKNFIWEIRKMNSERVVLRGTPNPEVEAAIGKEGIQSYPANLVRRGIFASMPRFVSLPVAPTRFTHYFDSGNNYLEMEMDLDQLFEIASKQDLRIANC